MKNAKVDDITRNIADLYAVSNFKRMAPDDEDPSDEVVSIIYKLSIQKANGLFSIFNFGVEVQFYGGLNE